MNQITNYWANCLFISLLVVQPAQNATAQSYPEISKELKDSVAEKVTSSLENARRLHEIGFHTTFVWDHEMNSKEFVEPKAHRVYGMIADKGHGEFRRFENAGWSVQGNEIIWGEGARLICNKSGVFLQPDPLPMDSLKILRPKLEISPQTLLELQVNTQTIYSPIGLITLPQSRIQFGAATPDALAAILKDTTLIQVLESPDATECLYLQNNHRAAIVMVYSKKLDGMVLEFRCLYRDPLNKGDLPPLENNEPARISTWMPIITVKAYWSKVGQCLVPSIVDHRESTPGLSRRSIYCFMDWAVGNDDEMSIFEEKKFFRKRIHNRNALMEVTHDYVHRQDEIDAKAKALKKKYGIDESEVFQQITP